MGVYDSETWQQEKQDRHMYEVGGDEEAKGLDTPKTDEETTNPCTVKEAIERARRLAERLGGFSHTK